MADTNNDEMFEIYTGREIALSQSYPLTSENEAKFIIVIGPHDAGKTTFISRIFDKFLDGHIEDWSFVGSETLWGYEKLLASYRSKSTSGRPRPDRTAKSKDPELFHLSLNHVSNKKHNLLIANLSGEIFDDLIANAEAIEDIRYFKQANHISVTLDGEKMQIKAGRDVEITNARTFLERLISSNILSNSTAVTIIISKADSFKRHQDDYFAQTIKKIQDDIIKQLKKAGLNVLPDPLLVISEPFKAIKGFGELLNIWTNEFSITTPKARTKGAVNSARAMDYYKAEKK